MRTASYRSQSKIKDAVEDLASTERGPSRLNFALWIIADGNAFSGPNTAWLAAQQAERQQGEIYRLGLIFTFAQLRERRLQLMPGCEAMHVMKPKNASGAMTWETIPVYSEVQTIPSDKRILHFTKKLRRNLEAFNKVASGPEAGDTQERLEAFLAGKDPDAPCAFSPGLRPALNALFRQVVTLSFHTMAPPVALPQEWIGNPGVVKQDLADLVSVSRNFREVFNLEMGPNGSKEK
mgnify:CR=1 FL=1